MSLAAASPAGTPRVAVPCGCALGEGPLWDHRTETLYWVDIERPSIWALAPGRGEPAEHIMPEAVSFVQLTREPGVLVAGFKSGLKYVGLRARRIEHIVDPEPDLAGNRLNDAAVGPTGVLYFGTQNEAEEEPIASFYAYDGRALRRFLSGFVITNGPALSPDGARLYTVNSSGGEVLAHEMDGEAPGEARPFLTFDEDEGVPDGIAVDETAHLWICQHGAGRITRFSPQGQPERVVEMPTKKPTKCAFGGPDLTTLFIATARQGCEDDPGAGHLYVLETGIRGLPAHPFRGAAGGSAR